VFFRARSAGAICVATQIAPSDLADKAPTVSSSGARRAQPRARTSRSQGCRAPAHWSAPWRPSCALARRRAPRAASEPAVRITQAAIGQRDRRTADLTVAVSPSGSENECALLVQPVGDHFGEGGGRKHAAGPGLDLRPGRGRDALLDRRVHRIARSAAAGDVGALPGCLAGCLAGVHVRSAAVRRS